MPGDRPGTTGNNHGAWYHNSRLCSTAAVMKDDNGGCGSNGRGFNSGWNDMPMKQPQATFAGNCAAQTHRRSTYKSPDSHASIGQDLKARS
jgi:hypothetical protein